MRNNTKSSIIAYQAGWQHTTAAITSNTPLCNLELLETDVLIAIEAFLRAQEIIINQLQLATKQLADDRDKTGRLTSLALQPAGCDKRLSDWVKNNKEVIIKCTPFEMCYHCVPHHSNSMGGNKTIFHLSPLHLHQTTHGCTRDHLISQQVRFVPPN